MLPELLDPRSRRAAPQSGFALLIVLSIMALFSLLIVAVLSQTSVATNLTAQQIAQARADRTADGGLEAAINQVRRHDPFNPPNQDVCDPVRPGGDPYEVEVDGMAAEVYCSIPDASDGGDLEVLIPTEPDTGRTRLVGHPAEDRAYLPAGLGSGDPLPAAWNVACPVLTPRDQADQRDWQEDCVPWGDALDVVWLGPSDVDGGVGYGASYMQNTVVNGLTPNLVHSAPEPLRFGGDVEVRGGVAAALNPARGSGPAINVGGEYRQGRAGSNFPGYTVPDECSFFSPLWGVLAGRSNFVEPQPDATVHDISGGPDCLDPDAAALRDRPGPGVTDASLAAPATWSTSDFANRDGVAVYPAVPSCSTPTTDLLPGVYPAAAMQQLNSLIDGCNATLNFQPGDYWFGGDLVIDNPEVKMVFGAQDGWEPQNGATEANFNSGYACSPDVDGVSITLRDRATIQHTAGRVAICNRETGSDTVIHQVAEAPSEWIVPQAAWAGAATDWSAPFEAAGTGSWVTAAQPTAANLAATNEGPARYNNTCSGSIFVTCNGRAGVQMTAPTGAPSPDLPINSMTLRVVGDSNDLLTGFDFLGSATIDLANNVAGGNIAGVRISARPAGGDWCQRFYQGLPNWGGAQRQALSYDLLASSPIDSEQERVETCWRPTFTTQGDLEAAEIRVDFLFRARFADLNPINWFSSPRAYWLEVDQLQLQSGWSVGPTASSNGAAGVLNRDGGSVSLSQRCRAFSCPAGQINFEAWDFSGSNATYLPVAGAPDHVKLEVTGRNQQAANPNGSYTRATITIKDPLNPNGPPKGTCAPIQVPHIPSFGQTFQLDVLNPDGTGPCAGVITDPLDIVHASVDFQVQLACYSPTFTRGCFRFLFGVGSISADIDHVRMVAFTTADNTRRRPMRFTMDASESGGGSTFAVDGDVSVPGRDLEIDWAGPAQDAPLIRGALTLNGLASFASAEDGEVGVVCCSDVRATNRQVMLTAVVNGTVRTRALVSVSDVDPTTGEPDFGRDVAVRSWNVCRTEVGGADYEQIASGSVSGGLECRMGL